MLSEVYNCIKVHAVGCVRHVLCKGVLINCLMAIMNELSYLRMCGVAMVSLLQCGAHGKVESILSTLVRQVGYQGLYRRMDPR